MRFTLRQLLDDPSKSKLLVRDDRIRLKIALEHFIEHEYVLTQRIRECRATLQLENYPEAEIIRIKDEIFYHQTTMQQLHTLYDCVQNHEYSAVSIL